MNPVDATDLDTVYWCQSNKQYLIFEKLVLNYGFSLMKRIYNSKWFPRFFYVKPDGGKNSGVTAYFLIERKILFSIGILRFNKGTREAYHNHAFNALTWWFKGNVTEIKIEGEEKNFKPSFIPKYTSKNNFHKVKANETTFALTFRGPWKNTWEECRSGKYVTHGRKEVC